MDILTTKVLPYRGLTRMKDTSSETSNWTNAGYQRQASNAEKITMLFLAWF
jgi:hypothetical protein